MKRIGQAVSQAAHQVSKTSKNDASASTSGSSFGSSFKNKLQKLADKFLKNFSKNSNSDQLNARREEAAKRLAAAQASQQSAENDGWSAPENTFTNLTPGNLPAFRHEHENMAHSSVRSDGSPKSFVTAEGALRPAGPTTSNLVEGGAHDRFTAMATTIFKHVMEREKGKSPLTSVTSGNAIISSTLSKKFGKSIPIDLSKANTISTEEAVNILLHALPEGGDEEKDWDWRKDKNLNLRNAAQEKKLEALMQAHGIDPNNEKFKAAEKAAVFVLATGESFVIGPTEDNAARIEKDPRSSR